MMKDQKRKIYYSWPILFLITMSMMVSGCVSYSTLQTPEVLNPGEVQVGAGTSIIIESPDEIYSILEIGGRFGVFKKVDIGLKYTLLNVLTSDMKYQFLDGKLNAAVDLETSIYASDGNYIFGIYPAILFGQKHWYAGIKSTFAVVEQEFNYAWSTIITGFRIGFKRFNALLELNSMIGIEEGDFEVWFYPSIGLNYTFNFKKSDN